MQICAQCAVSARLTAHVAAVRKLAKVHMVAVGTCAVVPKGIPEPAPHRL